MKKYLLFLFFSTALNVAEVSQAQGVKIYAKADCGDWVESRQAKTGMLLENYLLGVLDGFSLGRNHPFWNYKPIEPSPAQVFLWMDNYCSKNPLSNVWLGADELMNEHTEGTYRKKKKL